MMNPLMLCGAAFGLGAVCRDGVWRPLRRHRLFESNVWLMSGGCACSGKQPLGVHGHGGGVRIRGYMGCYADEKRAALGITWMRNQDDVNDAIPPAYTEYLGWQLLTQLGEAPP
jgi:DNA (cytosine-5)-methyltransferase 1